MAIRTDRVQAEKDWQTAWDRMDRNPTESNMIAEQEAWDRHAVICEMLWECEQPGCYTHSRDHAYCDEHRTR